MHKMGDEPETRDETLSEAARTLKRSPYFEQKEKHRKGARAKPSLSDVRAECRRLKGSQNMQRVTIGFSDTTPCRRIVTQNTQLAFEKQATFRSLYPHGPPLALDRVT